MNYKKMILIAFIFFQILNLFSQINEELLPYSIKDKWGVFNLQGDTIIPFNFHQVVISKNIPFIGVMQEMKWAIFDFKGKQLTPFKYSKIDIDGLSIEIIPVEISTEPSLWGVVDKNGNEKISNGKYTSIKSYANNVARVSILKKNKILWGLIDKSGKEITPIKYNFLGDFTKNGLSRVNIESNNGLNSTFGYIDATGKEIVPCTQEPLTGSIDEYSINKFTKGYAVIAKRVGSELLFGLIDSTGELKIPYIYSNLQTVDMNCIIAIKKIGQQQYKTGIINFKGEIVISFEYDEISKPINDLYIVGKYIDITKNKDKVIGVIDRKGNILIPIKYKTFISYQGYWKCCTFDYKMVFYNKNGEEIMPPKFSYNNKDYFPDKNNNFIFLQNNKYGLANISGKEIIPSIYDEMIQINENLFIVKSLNKYGIIDKNINIIVPIKYQKLSPIIKNYIYVTQDNLNGIMNYNGEIIIPIKYPYLRATMNKYFIASLDENYGVIDTTNKNIVPFIYNKIEELTAFNTNNTNKYLFYKIRNGSKYGIIDKSGKIILQCNYFNVFIADKTGSFFCVELNSKFGIYNNIGKEIIPPKYETLLRVANNFIYFEQEHKMHYFKLDGSMYFK